MDFYLSLFQIYRIFLHDFMWIYTFLNFPHIESYLDHDIVTADRLLSLIHPSLDHIRIHFGQMLHQMRQDNDRLKLKSP